MTHDMWTNEDIGVMRYFFQKGKTDDEIAALMGRNSNSIRSKRQKLGMRIHPKPEVKHPAVIVNSITTPKRAESLPDVSEQVWSIRNELAMMKQVLVDIVHCSERMQKDTDAMLTIQSEQLALFKKIDGAKHEGR